MMKTKFSRKRTYLKAVPQINIKNNICGMTEEIIEKLVKHILKVYDSNDNEISYTNLSIAKESRRFSNTMSLVVYMDNIPLTTNQVRSYKVLYRCRCGREQKILLVRYLRKKEIWCRHCVQDKSFDNYIIGNKKDKPKKEVIRKEFNFELESDEFKKKYFNNHLSEEEFYKYLPYVYSVNHINIEGKNIEYIEAEPTVNQQKYTSRVLIDGKKQRLDSFELKCAICGKIFSVHSFNIRKKNLNHIECRDCSFSNRRYKIQRYKDTNLTYQSRLEYDFIEKCKETGIRILNCFKIKYIFNNKVHTYIPDFYLPDYKLIIELKSENQYYTADLKSGKIDAKNTAANLYAKEHGMNFVFLFNYMVDDFWEQLLNKRDSLNECNSINNRY